MHGRQGRIEVICGSMFSGKSERLVSRLDRAMRYEKRRVIAFKHASDVRYHDTYIGCHGGLRFPARPVLDPKDIETMAVDYEVVGIDEGQFFNSDLVAACTRMADAGKRVIIAGLDLDSQGNPFPPMPALMAVAELVKKQHAVCVVCGDEASRSYHKIGKDTVIEVGAAQYEARCRKCFNEGQTK